MKERFFDRSPYYKPNTQEFKQHRIRKLKFLLSEWERNDYACNDNSRHDYLSKLREQLKVLGDCKNPIR